jgi:AcrR family transcriptional regulator
MAAPDPEPPWWTPRKAPTPRRALSREAIVATALDVLRAEGMDAVSMRRVAADLGTGPASLYAHVTGKDELLDLLYDEVVGTIPLPVPDPARWQEQATQLWSDCRDALARAGDIARYSLGRVPMGPNALRLSELTMTLLRMGGVPDQAVAWAVDVVGHVRHGQRGGGRRHGRPGPAGAGSAGVLRPGPPLLRGPARRPLPGHRDAGAAAHGGHGGRAVPLRPRPARRRVGRARYRNASPAAP